MLRVSYKRERERAQSKDGLTRSERAHGFYRGQGGELLNHLQDDERTLEQRQKLADRFARLKDAEAFKLAAAADELLVLLVQGGAKKLECVDFNDGWAVHAWAQAFRQQLETKADERIAYTLWLRGFRPFDWIGPEPEWASEEQRARYVRRIKRAWRVQKEPPKPSTSR